jgi:hypothetical protein
MSLVDRIGMVPRHPARSWVDRWIARVDRFSLPAWLLYLLLLVLQLFIVTAPAWLSGALPVGHFSGLHLLMAMWTVLPLALIQHLNHFARQALERFRPATQAGDVELDRLGQEMSGMPARPAALAGAVGVVFVWIVYFVSPELFQSLATSTLQLVVSLVVLSLNFALLGTLSYHTVRQLSLVRHTYDRARPLDLYNLKPLYAFSAYTARTAIAWAAALYLTVALFPEFLQSSLALAFLAAQIVLVLAAFVLPLVGIHLRLDDAKERALVETDQRLKEAIAEINRRTDEMALDDMPALDHMVNGLVAARKAVDRIPTWPWRPGTPLAVLTTLLLPVVIYLIQRGLATLFGL